jgi:hypothetical protein
LLIARLEQLGHQEVKFERIKAGIEDCFMDLMKTGNKS